MREKEKDMRTSVSLSGTVWKWAEELMREDGFNGNFSSFVADLVRRRKESRGPAELRETPPAYTVSTITPEQSNAIKARVARLEKQAAKTKK
jgi:hypothetical protein